MSLRTVMLSQSRSGLKSTKGTRAQCPLSALVMSWSTTGF